MNIFDFIDSFSEDDIFDADKRRRLEVACTTLARFHFDDIYEEDLSSVASLINANYYEMAKSKLAVQVC